ncbi:MAG TPA: hypothetical protein VFH11_01610, partial [Gemmatimonadota bacterium]|nr:hypothetical protein [Gemmatimonadota bacterium]
IVTGLEAALSLGDQAKVDEILTIVRTDPIGRRTRFFLAQGARIDARLGTTDDEEAERFFRSAVRTFREIGFPFWLAVTLLEYGEWLESRDRGPDVAPLVLEARSIFESLQAKPWVERAERIGQESAAVS